MGIVPKQQWMDEPSQVDTLLVRTGMVKCEQTPQSEGFTCCSDNLSSLC